VTTLPQTPAVIGYVDALTARPGDIVTLRISVLDGSRPYRAGLVRLISGETGPKGPGLKEEAIATNIDGEHDGETQYTDVGSYAIVDDLPALSGVVELALLARPGVASGAVQTLMALGPLRLVLDETGAAALVVGDATISTERPLRLNCGTASPRPTIRRAVPRMSPRRRCPARMPTARPRHRATRQTASCPPDPFSSPPSTSRPVARFAISPASSRRRICAAPALRRGGISRPISVRRESPTARRTLCMAAPSTRRNAR